jgi:hypothetical protein
MGFNHDDVEAIATFLCHRDHDASAPCGAHEEAAYAALGRASGPHPVTIVRAAKEVGAWGTCDWCGDENVVIAIDSTAGKRCRDCYDKPLCSWCGEAEGLREDTLCATCREERSEG